MSTLIQSGVDIASDGLTPLLNKGSQFSVFSRRNISANHLDSDIASSEERPLNEKVIMSSESPSLHPMASRGHWR